VLYYSVVKPAEFDRGVLLVSGSAVAESLVSQGLGFLLCVEDDSG
jgi:hypothetical protein